MTQEMIKRLIDRLSFHADLMRAAGQPKVAADFAQIADLVRVVSDLTDTLTTH